MEGQKGGGGGRRRTIEDLTDDLMVEILHHLPLSSIIRCLIVCKQWQSLIACSPLLHTNTINVGVHYNGYEENYTCLEKGGMQQFFSELDFSFDFPNKKRYSNRIQVSCNGLLFSCYSIGRDNLFPQSYISNPWTKECVRIQNPTLSNHDYLCGLAFESNSSHHNINNNEVAVYKIVMAQEVNEAQAPYKFQMYSSNKKRWQCLSKASEPGPNGGCTFNQNAVYCNRVLYWQCRWKAQKLALKFNLETETSGYLGLPSDHDHDGDHDYSNDHNLMDCDGQLHYIRTGTAQCRVIIWKMSTSGGWLILHNVDLKGVMERNLGPFHRTRIGVPYIKPVGMTLKGDDKVLLNHYNKRIVSYDLKKGVLELDLEKESQPLHYYFRYSPTTKFISER